MPVSMTEGSGRGSFSLVHHALVACLIVLAPWIAAHAHPNGGAGYARTWRPEWTTYFNECFAEEGKALREARPADKRTYCSNTNPSMSENDYWLSIFIPIARAESGFNSRAVGRNGAKRPMGLFQMNADDMARYKCDGRNPLDPRQAICCAIKIGSYWADYWEERGEQWISNGKQGILATFFQPIRTGIGGDGRGGRINDTRKFRALVASSNRLCQYAPATGQPSIGSSGRYFTCTDPFEVVPQPRLPAWLGES